MPNVPLVTIVTPSFNQGQFVEETIQSVLNQSYKNIQYIFVDGGSADETMAIVKKYREKIDTIIHEKDRGQADAINKGFKLARGTLVGWLNSDDILYQDCVEKIVDLFLRKPDGAIYYHSNNDMIDEKGSIIRQYQNIIPDRDHLLKNDYNLIQQGSFYNSNHIREVNYLNVDNQYCMDLDLWLNLLLNGPIYWTSDKAHSAFRIYPGTKTDTGKEDFLANIYKVLKSHGAKPYHSTIYKKIWFYYFKCKIKRVVTR